MKNIFLIILLFFIFQNNLSAQDDISKVSSPEEVSAEATIPKEFKDLVWNRWTSQNFIVCSLNDLQAQYLHRHLEDVKTWTFSRWGIEDVEFSVPCKLICVDSKDLFKKLFNIEKTRVEIRRNSEGSIVETVIFLLIDGTPSQTVPVPLAEVCIAELGQKYYDSFLPWAYKGMSKLNGDIDNIKKEIYFSKNKEFFDSKKLLETNKEEYESMSEHDKELFNSYSVIFCLMIRKEFGQDIYLKFLEKTTKENAEHAINNILKFKDYENFDNSFKRYHFDIIKELENKKIPSNYLQIIEK